MSRLKHIIKNTICFLLISAILLPFFCKNAYALESWPEGCYTASEGACLIDADSGTVLYGKNMDTPYYPASITKVLTALIVLEECEDLTEKVTFSYDAVNIEEENATIIGASEGDVLSVLDCLYSLLFQSANEVANALAEHVGAKHPELKSGGMTDRDVFVKMMNDKAEELGCTGSNFNNPSGLTDSDHYTTAYDMCLIMAAAVKNEKFLEIQSRTYWTHAPIKRYPDADDPWNTVYPKHSMLKKNSDNYYEGTIAGKTGYTSSAGNTLLTACERDGLTLVACVLNGNATHYNDTIRMMDFGFDNFTSIKINDVDNINKVIQSDFSIGGITLIDGYTIGVDEDMSICIPKSGSYADVEKTLEIGGEDGNTPILTFTYGDRVVGQAELKFMNLSAASDMAKQAEEDPLLAKILGAESAGTGALAVNGAEDGQQDTDDGESAEYAAGDSLSASIADASTESAQAEALETAAGDLTEDTDTVTAVSRLEGEFSTRRILIAAACIIAVIAAAFFAFKIVSERRIARHRAKKRNLKKNGGSYIQPDVRGKSALGAGYTMQNSGTASRRTGRRKRIG